MIEMDLFSAVLLGLLQGIFEWLPVSSQGQIMGFAIAFMGIAPEAALKLSVFLHIGTLLAAAIYFRKELLSVFKEIIETVKNPEKLKEKNLGKFLFIALAATAVTAIPAYIILKIMLLSFPSSLVLVALALLLFFMGYTMQSIKSGESEGELTEKNAIILGLAQGLAVFPGISRSGITSSALLFRKFSPEQAFRISFILSVPSVLVAELAFSAFEGFSIGFPEVIGLLVAFVSGYISIHALLKIARRINFSLFCYGFGALYLIISLSAFFNIV